MSRTQSPRSRQSDIAREAGVSQSTVSMVLSGAADLGRISAQTQRKVLAAARRLRYTPATPPKAAAAPPLLGVHTFEPLFPTSAGDYYFEFLQGMEEQAGLEGANLVLFTAARDDDGQRRIYDGEVNRLRQAAGSLLLGHHTRHDDLARLADDGHPFVYIGRREVPGREICYVGGDYRAATGHVVDDLVAMGHRTFGYLGEVTRYEPQTDRWEGFAAALERFGLSVPEPVFARPEELTAQWLDTAVLAGTTAILVESVNQLRVLSAMAALRGLTIPGDLSVVLLVDDPAGEVAALHIPRNPMGRRAVRMLITLLADPDGEYERQVLLPCTHTLTGTVAPPTPR